MKRALSIILAAAMSAAVFSGCNDENVSKYIPDGNISNSTTDSTDSTADSSTSAADTGIPQKETEALDTVVNDYKYDFWSNDYDSYTITDKYIYFDRIITLGSAGKQIIQDYKINLQSGEMTPLCNVPDCHHSFTDMDCESFIPRAAIGDKCYTLKRTGINESRTIIDESGNVVFENKFATDLSLKYAEQRMEEYDSNRTGYDEDIVKYRIHNILADDKNLYITGSNYIYAYNVETKQTTEPLIIDEEFPCRLLGADMDNKRVYFSNEVFEVFMADVENQTVTKVYDGEIKDLKGYNGKIYYARFLPRDSENPDAPATAQIFEADPDFTNEKLLVNGCANAFIIKEDKIFYLDPLKAEQQQQIMLHSYDMNTGESAELFAVEDVMRMVTAPHIDRIFVMGHHTDNTGISTVSNTTIISFRPDGSDIWTNEVKNQEGLY